MRAIPRGLRLALLGVVLVAFSVASAVPVMASPQVHTGPPPPYIPCSVVVWKTDAHTTKTDILGTWIESQVIGAWDSRTTTMFCDETYGFTSGQEGATECNAMYAWAFSINLTTKQSGGGTASGCGTLFSAQSSIWTVNTGDISKECSSIAATGNACASFTAP